MKKLTAPALLFYITEVTLSLCCFLITSGVHFKVIIPLTHFPLNVIVGIKCHGDGEHQFWNWINQACSGDTICNMPVSRQEHM